ncbi:MAG: E3 binding domain-containing protein [Gemmatimonadota bacterium]
MDSFSGPARWPAEPGGKRSVQANKPGGAFAQPEPPVAAGPDATDAAKALAAEHGIDLRDVTGTGNDGRITKDDVQAIVDAATAEPVEPVPDEAETPAAETA